MITYDYPATKSAHEKLVATVDAFKENAKALQQTGQEVIEGNTADGVVSTMSSFGENQQAVLKIMDAAVEESTKALRVAQELHEAAGGAI